VKTSKNTKAKKEVTPEFTEYTVTVRIKAKRLEYFSLMSDQLGLTRDQAVSAMLESNMEADRDNRTENAQAFTAESAAQLYPERKMLRVLFKALENVNSAEYAAERAKGEAMVDLFDIAPKEMGLVALRDTKVAMLRGEFRKTQAKKKAVKS
jgi:hypothetical protein